MRRRTNCVVLREKLRVPEASGLVRERLIATPSPSANTTLVVAPAGCGKTTLLSHLAAAAGAPVGWYAVTEDDTCESRFVAHVAAALGGFVATEAVASLPGLLAALDDLTAPSAVLFLDDVEAIAGSAAERTLERFLTLRPPRLRVVCASRHTPDVNVSRLRVSGSLSEIGVDDLRFLAREVEDLFATVYHAALQPDAAAALARSTGGWAAALWLFQLATAHRDADERHRAVADLGGRCRHVRDYLTRNVIGGLSRERREFLLRTAPLGRMSGEICDTLLSVTGSHRILAELEAAQLFTSTDDGGRHFRYHEVLRTHLELTLVEEYGVAEAREWYRRSGQVLEQFAEPCAAARAYARAGDVGAEPRLARTTGGGDVGPRETARGDDRRLMPVADQQRAGCRGTPSEISAATTVPRQSDGPSPTEPSGDADAAVAITCFGEFGIEAGGQAVAVNALRPQARRVLQILALAPGRNHHREFLEDLLWPGVPHSVAAHRLQVAVSSVRRLLTEWGVTVERRGESYRLRLPAAATVDVKVYTDAVATASMLSARGDIDGRMAARRAALDSYTGDLLPELTGVAHVDADRDRLRRLAAAAAGALAADHRARGEREWALAAADRAVQLDPEQDTAWSVLAELHADLGDAAPAEYVRREHARIRAEIGVPVAMG